MSAACTQPDTSPAAFAERGMTPQTASIKSAQFEVLEAALNKLDTTGKPTRAYFVPGRIEVLGKHVDYAGGHSLTCATEQGFALLARPRKDWRIRMIDPVNKLEASFPLNPELEPLTSDWTNYPMTVARRVARNFVRLGPGHLRGCDIAFTSDLPQAAGLSSSSALIVAVFMAIADVNRLAQHPAYTAEIKSELDLAGYLGSVENGAGYGSLTGDRGVGTKGGSQDHTAILCAQAGTLGQFAYRPVKLERRVCVPDNLTFAVGVSGVHAVKTGNAKDHYNSAVDLAMLGIDHWNKKTSRKDPHLAAAATSAPDGIEKLRTVIKTADDAVRVRVEQFLDENYRIIPNAGDALQNNDLQTLGQLTDESQHGAETMLHNQVPQTIRLANTARQHGALAASAFGAGFGGSVWALVQQDNAQHFIDQWSTAYRQAFPNEAQHATFITTRPGPGAMRLNVE